MIAWYVARGKYKLEDFIDMGYVEKRILHCARFEYYEEEKAKYQALGGGI